MLMETPLQIPTPLHSKLHSIPRLHFMTPLHKLHDALSETVAAGGFDLVWSFKSLISFRKDFTVLFSSKRAAAMLVVSSWCKGVDYELSVNTCSDRFYWRSSVRFLPTNWPRHPLAFDLRNIFKYSIFKK